MGFVEQSITKIKSAGGRLTTSKKRILKALEGINVPLNSNQLAKEIEKSGDKIDAVTVYRVLKTFKELKIVHHFENGFIPCEHLSCENHEHSHHYFSCNKCKEVKDLHIEDEKFLNLIKNKFKSIEITSHEFKFNGVCNECIN